MSAPAPRTPAPVGPAGAPATDHGSGTGRRAHLTALTLQVLLALFLGGAGALPKLIGHSSAAESFDRIGFGDWFMYAVGALELAGAVALLIPVLSGAAALALIGLMAGAFVTQVTVFDGQYAFTPVLVALPLAVVARVRRHRNAELVALLLRRR
ncbi:DoxX family protein [Streptomyces marianii]|uniref:DoxX family protein n=1 Tax=Streptomyces marianii TaxID=1817406 RepID=A0A5R9E9N8_9ACTN|nr:DoxX family protein [Streptomyces marianii]TLQ46626.1 DoxX family protein [Streptomyces marianii]